MTDDHLHAANRLLQDIGDIEENLAEWERCEWTLHPCHYWGDVAVVADKDAWAQYRRASIAGLVSQLDATKAAFKLLMSAGEIARIALDTLASELSKETGEKVDRADDGVRATVDAEAIDAIRRCRIQKGPSGGGQ